MVDVTQALEWHKPAHRAVMANVALGAWMSAALDDPTVCDAMKADIREWFSAGEPMEMLGQALTTARAEADALRREIKRLRYEIYWIANDPDLPRPFDTYLRDTIACAALSEPTT